MKYVWKKHTIGKRILALFLLVIMLFDTVTATAVEYNGEESIQTEFMEVVENTTEQNSEITVEPMQNEVYAEAATEAVAGTETVIISEENEIADETEKIVTSETNALDNLIVTFSGYKAYLSGSVSNPFDSECELYLKSYDASGNELDSLYLWYFSEGENWRPFSNGETLNKNTDYIQLVLVNLGNNDTYSKTYDFEYVPIVVGTFENILIIPKGFGAEIKGSFTPGTKEYGEIYLVSYDKSDNRLLSTHIASIRDGEKVSLDYNDGEIANNAAYVRLEAKLNDTSLGAEAVYSDKIAYSATRPSVNFALKELQTGVGTLKMTVSYDGDFALEDSFYYQAKLIYGTSEDETTWTETATTSLYLRDERTESTAIFQDLSADTTYYGKVHISYNVFDHDTYTDVILYETSLNLGIFTTKENHTYKLNEVFPDEALRALVIENISGSSLTGESDVTTAQLEEITDLYYYRTSGSQKPVRDLTGITLLTNLTEINMINNEISDISDIDWSMLKELSYIDLSGNNIKVFPDLSKNTKLYNVLFDANMLSEEELKNVSSKLPAGITLSNYDYESQRVDVVELVLEDAYYLYGTVTNIIAEIKGKKCYAVKAYIDGIEVTAELTYSSELVIKQLPVTAGEHKLKVALYDGTTTVCESKEYTITIINEPVFARKGSYNIPVDLENVFVYIYYLENKDSVSLELVDNAGKIYGRTQEIQFKGTTNMDPRLESEYYGLGENFLFYAGGKMVWDYTAVPAGVYDVKINYSDGTSDVVEDIVNIVGKGTPILQRFFSIAYDYENLDEYVYIELRGYNLDPTGFDYSLCLNNKEYALSYVEHKVEDIDSVNVKCKKEGWSSFKEENRGKNADIHIIPKKEYSVLSEAADVDAKYYIDSEYDFVYYAEYNNVINKLEVGVDDKYLNQTAQIFIRNTDDQIIGTATAVVAEGATLFELKNPDGTVFVPVNGQQYYYTVRIGADESENDIFSYYNTRVARWSSLELWDKDKREFPVTLQVYKPYSTTLIKEVIIADESKLENDYYYPFTKSFWTSLPNTDLMYDAILSDANGYVRTYTNIVFGYETDREEDEVKAWSYTVDKTSLNIDSTALKTATITVKDYKKAPSFKSSNTAVAKVAVSAANKGKAVITAVGEGTATITITADGTSKTFNVTVVSTVPKVSAQNKVVINTFFGNDARTALEITNSFGTEITDVTIAENTAGLTVSKMDGIWYLCWSDETKKIAKNTKVTLSYKVAGFEATDDLNIAPQTITVNGVSTMPEAVLSAAAINFNAYPYTEPRFVELSVNKNDDRNLFDVKPEGIVLTSVPRGVTTENAKVTVTYNKETSKLSVSASNDAVNGTYKFTITPGVGTECARAAKAAVLTVNLKAVTPAFKFNTTTVTLDAAYPGFSEAVIKLLMDEGYELEKAVIKAPNSSVEDFIRTESNKDGTISFKVLQAGLLSAGKYKITATVKTPWGGSYELKTVSVNVKVTNSSTATVSSKSKSVTINPYIGEATVKAALKVKGFVPQNHVNYTTAYNFIPTNDLAKKAGVLPVADENGNIVITGWNGYEAGKYTYNFIGIVEGTDGTEETTKAMPFTITVKAKALTIVPSKSSVTVYKEYCTIVKKGIGEEAKDYYKVEIPVCVKEASGMILNTNIINSMAGKDVTTYFDNNKLVVEFPTSTTKLGGLKLTPDNSTFAPFKVSISVKSSEAKASFAEKTVTLNRYLATEVENTVADTEGYVIESLGNIIIRNKKKVDVTNQFVTTSDGNKVTISIAEGCIDTVENGDYTVSAEPTIRIAGSPKTLPACTFKLKLAQPKLKVSIGDAKKSSQTVNLYPQIGEGVSEELELNVYCGNEKLDISKVEIKNTAKEANQVADGSISENNTVNITARADKTGKNTFSAKIFVRNKNGSENIDAGTLKSAFVVNVKAALPGSISLAKTSLNFSPYMEGSVSTTIKSAELEALMKTGDYQYSITATETKSNYKTVLEEENGIIQVSGDANGRITVDNKGLPTKNATYYYKLAVEFRRIDGTIEPLKYTAKLKVSVKNTLPKAVLQMNTVSLNNAFVNQEVTNRVILKTGTGLWTLDALDAEDIVVMSGKNDITDKGYFAIERVGTQFSISLNNMREDGTLITAPKGTYKVILTPHITERVADTKLQSALKALTLTVKVVSSRPTVTVNPSTVKVDAGNAEAVKAKVTLSNKGSLTSITAECTKLPKNVKDAVGIEVSLLDSGTIGVKADEMAAGGTYTYKIYPVTMIDGKEILLDAVTMKVTVKAIMPVPVQTKKITVAAFEGGYGNKLWKEVAAAYTKETGIKVELIIDQKLEDIIEPSMQSGKFPDVVHLSTGRSAGLTEQFIEEKRITDITDVLSMTIPGEKVKVSDKIAGGFTESVLTNPYGDGKTYLAPMFYSPCGLFYNAGLLEEKGWEVPTTWDEMWALGDLAKAEDIALFTYPTAGYLDAVLYALMYSIGGADFFNAAANYEEGIWDTAEGQKVFEILGKLAEYTHPTTPAQANNQDFTQNQQLVLDNRAIFMPNGTWIVGEMKNATRAEGFKWGMTALPAVETGGTGYCFSWFEQAWIPKEAKNQDAAKQFIAFLYSDKACEIFAKYGAIQPVLEIADKLTGDVKMFYSIYDNGAKAAIGSFAQYKTVEGVGTIYEEFCAPMNSLVAGTLTIEQWLANVKEANDIMRENIIKNW